MSNHTGAGPFLEAMSKQDDTMKLIKLYQELWDDSSNNMYNLSKWQSTFKLLLKTLK